jgi:hypothetical protein
MPDFLLLWMLCRGLLPAMVVKVVAQLVPVPARAKPRSKECPMEHGSASGSSGIEGALP